MKTVGIKLADGSFYPVLQEGSSEEVALNLTTANNNQTKVMVDLYRSKTNSMEDAEYVDSLQIENLIEHPNGEPNISFTVSLDENNELHAKIVDSETGATSNSTITLVSRTSEERLFVDNYNITPEVAPEPEVEIPVEETAVEEPVAEQPEIETTTEPEAETTTETTAEPEVETEDPEQTEAAAVAAMATGVGLLAAAEALRNKEEEESPSFEDASAFEETELPDFDEIPEESSPDISSPDEEMELPNFDELPDTTVESQMIEDDLSAFGGEAFSDQQAELTDFFNAAESEAETPTPEDSIDFEVTESPVFEDTDLPDFDEPAFDSALDTSLDAALNSDFDTDLTSDLDTSFDSDFDTPAAGGINFSGLYDNDSTFDDQDDTKKKTKVPVIICVICAIICLIAVALLLFVLPTKYNLISNGKIKSKAKTEKVAPANPVEEVTEEPVTEPEIEETPVVEEIPEAQEDEIIIIEKAEEVIPLPPPVAEKPKDITYKIKWGDTLWDISDTYYKNPWRYKYIARYNGIKDPDYIISGTYITIPAE